MPILASNLREHRFLRGLSEHIEPECLEPSLLRKKRKKKKKRKMIEVVWDMESGDPDDYFTLLLLADHPDVRLKAVTITPGSTLQVGLVRKTLAEFGLSIPVGAFRLDHPKPCVSKWHERIYGAIRPSSDAEDGGRVLCENCDESTTLVTGAALKNAGSAIGRTQDGSCQFTVGQMFIQGGFAGAGVVPDELQMEKFRGRATCATYNLNGDIPSTFAVLGHADIGVRHFVSKNVCHRVHYDAGVHERFRSLGVLRKNQQWIYRGMDDYLRRHPDGKKFHDPLAACCAIEPMIGTWSEVEVYRERGQWGSRLSPDTNTWIITDYDHERFLRTLMK